MKRINIEPGTVFGDLTVICYSHSNGHDALYKCKCECGNIIDARSWNLRNNKKTNCGCKNKKVGRGKALPHDVAAKRVIRCHIKCCARSRNIEYGISDEEVFKLIDKPCYYCGKEKAHTLNTRHYSYKYNGIDRVDNSKGYISGNCVPCCIQCNKYKSSMTQEEYREWITRVYNNYCTENNTK